MENQTIFSDDIYSDQLLSALNGYYDKLVKWVTDTVIPQAQVAIVAVTGGIWSVVIFLKNLLIGMMISVYLLARKESFAKQSKKILYAILPETPYRRTLRAVAEADRIFAASCEESCSTRSSSAFSASSAARSSSSRIRRSFRCLWA